MEWLGHMPPTPEWSTAASPLPPGTRSPVPRAGSGSQGRVLGVGVLPVEDTVPSLQASLKQTQSVCENPFPTLLSLLPLQSRPQVQDPVLGILGAPLGTQRSTPCGLGEWAALWASGFSA